MPKQLTLRLVQPEAGESTITVIYRGKTYTATESHPMWAEILRGALEDDPKVVNMFDIARAVGQRKSLSDRISVASGRVFFDNDLVDDALATHISRLLTAGEDFKPFVALMENIAMNPDEGSRKQLYVHLKRHHFTITEDGMIVGYKGVLTAGGDKPWKSSTEGPSIVNGEYHEAGHVHQGPGDVVELPRSEVLNNPSQACAPGLHVANWQFASTFTSGPTIEVHVHPRDVVSVPSGSDEKVRVCRYRVIDARKQPWKEPVLHVSEGQVAVAKPEVASKPAVKHPSEAVFKALKLKARAQRSGIKKIATRHGLELITGDGSQRTHWRVK